jgi:hypothetical protein
MPRRSIAAIAVLGGLPVAALLPTTASAQSGKRIVRFSKTS